MSIAATLAALACSFQDDGVNPSLEALTGDFSGIQGAVGSFDAALAPLESALVGPGSFDGTFAAALPALEGSFHVPDSLAAELEPLSASLVALNGGIGSMSARLRPLSASLAAIAAGTGAMAASLAPMRASMAGTAEGIGTMAGSLRPLRGQATGIAGTVGGFAASLEALEFAADGHSLTSGSMDARFAPMYAELLGEQAVEAAFRAWATNSRNGAVTEYTAFPYNSFARYNGAYLAAGPNGLFSLGGLDDDGEDIAWELRTGRHDDKRPELKRLTEVLMGLKAAGSIRVRVWKDEEENFEYVCPIFREDATNQVRVQPGRGLRSRYYQVGLSGTAGAEIDSLQLTMPSTTRRVG